MNGLHFIHRYCTINDDIGNRLQYTIHYKGRRTLLSNSVVGCAVGQVFFDD